MAKKKPTFFIWNKTKKGNNKRLLDFIPKKMRINDREYKIGMRAHIATGLTIEKNGSVQVYYEKKPQKGAK